MYTLQALSEEDRKSWMDVMDGKEPVSEEHSPIMVCNPVEDGQSMLHSFCLLLKFLFVRVFYLKCHTDTMKVLESLWLLVAI